jgi:hypothetical protein
MITLYIYFLLNWGEEVILGGGQKIITKMVLAKKSWLTLFTVKSLCTQKVQGLTEELSGNI